MCVVVSADDADRAIDVLASAGETARVIGHIREGERTVEIS
jgi:phosphoribosylaminoimidazole (AIR) synthetase